jgi:REP element-mobilizing transposase RayT
MDETWKWFHLTTHTYGAWLYGSPRSFRTRHHCEHIEGDYKNPPPPGKYDKQFQRSKRLLKQEPVKLSPEWRKVIGLALIEKLQALGAQVLTVCVGATHIHVLAKMPPGPVPRTWVGRAKKHAHFICKEKGWTGKLWAIRGKVQPIKDRQHQLNTFQYILDHIHEGAWVWDFRKGEIVVEESPGTAVPGLSENSSISPGTAVPESQ